jgi:hypothetical protein
LRVWCLRTALWIFFAASIFAALMAAAIAFLRSGRDK